MNDTRFISVAVYTRAVNLPINVCVLLHIV